MAQEARPDRESVAGSAGLGIPRIRWEDSQVRSAYANVIGASATQEEISLSFGMQHVLRAEGTEVCVQGLRRIHLAPPTARQLLAALAKCVRAYEQQHGTLDLTPESLTVGHARSGDPGCRSPGVRHAAEQTGYLFQLLESLNVELGFERSFKMAEKSLLGNRFLLGFSPRAIPDPRGTVVGVCQRLGMPRDFLREFEDRLPVASYVHFGFEEGETACLYKAYLEFWEKSDRDRMDRRRDAAPRLLHLGFKWDNADASRQSISRYTWYPWIPIEEIQKRAAAILDPRIYGHGWEVTRGILNMAAERVPPEDILYLEVTEDGNPRRSFDINTYRANLLVGELYPLLLKMSKRYSIPLDRFFAQYEPAKQRTFGHVSGGIDREGRDFLTVYYGVEYLAASRRPAGLPGVTIAAALDSAGRPELPPRISGVELTDEKAGTLFRLVHDLGVKVGRERSLKLLKNRMLADRYLVGFERQDASGPSQERILDICRRIDMPDVYLSTFREWLPEATIVLFGFERGERRLYKAYLEFGKRIAAALHGSPSGLASRLIHLGFKWDADDNSCKTEARYTIVPVRSVETMLTRIDRGFYAQTAGSPIQIVEWVIRLAASRVDPAEFLYFEAEEAGNPRASYDINMYRANLRMAELYPLLGEVCRHYAIPKREFRQAYEGVRTQIFGHLTGGTDREGRDFLTIYFGERGSSRERSTPRP